MNGFAWRLFLVLLSALWLPAGASAASDYVWVVSLDAVVGTASYLGVGLMMLGVGLMIAEAFLPSFGIIGLLGIAAFLAGAVLAANSNILGFTVQLPTMFTIAAIGAACLICLVVATLKSRQRQIVSGDAGLVGSLTTITALETDNPLGGWVELQGEHWQVLGQIPLRPGQQVRVVARRGLTLEVASVLETPQPGD